MKRLAPGLPAALILLLGCPPADDDDSAADVCVPTAGDSWDVDDGEEGQIHPRSRLIDGRLWTAYNRPDGSNTFGVFVVGRECDGTLAFGPERVDANNGNATDPDLAWSGDRVLVAWQTDDSNQPDNLSVRTAVLDLDGTVVQPDQRLATTTAAGPFAGNAWMARIAPLSTGFGVALARASSNGQWQIALQRLDFDGQSTDPTVAITAGIEGAFEPALASQDDTLLVAWQNSFDGTGDFGLAELRAGSDTATPVDWSALLNAGAGVAIGHDRDGTLWGGFSNSGARIVLGELGEAYGAQPAEGVSAIMSGPGLALRQTGGVIAWNEGAATNATLHARSWSTGGAATFAFDSDRTAIASSVGAYATDVVALSDDLVAFTYAVGPSPGFRLTTQIVSLP